MSRFTHIDASCATLARLAEYIPQWGIHRSASQVAHTLCGYFEGEFCHHFGEQEKSLFPVLRAGARRHQVEDMDRLIGQLVVEHRAIHAAWQGLRTELEAIAAGGGSALPIPAVESFITLYREHARHEDEQLSALGVRTWNHAEP
jgi:hemerythrin-like domain-containing protein